MCPSKDNQPHRADHPKRSTMKIRATCRRMHADAGPPRGIRIRDPARPVGTFRRATLADATAKADHPAIAQTEAAIAVIAAVAIRAVAAAAITAEADREVARAAPVQAAVAAMATAAGMEAVRAEAEANADRIGVVPRLSHHVPHDATRIIRMGDKTALPRFAPDRLGAGHSVLLFLEGQTGLGLALLHHDTRCAEAARPTKQLLQL